MENLKFAKGILRELRQKAEADGEKLLTYLIDMAYLEAGDRICAHWIGSHEYENRPGQGLRPPRKKARHAFRHGGLDDGQGATA